MRTKNNLAELYNEDLGDLSSRMARKRGFKVVDVPGKGVDADGNPGSNLGVTRFDRKEIYMPAWLPKALRDYVLGHEAFVEAYGRPSNAEDHALKEKEYLEGLKKDGYMNEYLAGIAMHYIRNKSGNRGPFRWISNYINRAVSEYKDSDAFQYHMANIEKTLRNKDAPDFKSNTVDKGYNIGEGAVRKGYRLGKEISASGGLGKYIKNLAADKLDDFAARYNPAMRPAMQEVG